MGLGNISLWRSEDMTLVQVREVNAVMVCCLSGPCVSRGVWATQHVLLWRVRRRGAPAECGVRAARVPGWRGGQCCTSSRDQEEQL